MNTTLSRPNRLRALPQESMGIESSLLLLGCLVLSTAGCATLLNGTHQEVHFRSNPSGATLKVGDIEEFETPVTLSIERLHPVEVTLRAEGHEPVTVHIRRRVSALVLGNAFCLILPGLVVDFLSGAAYELEREIFVRLPPLPAEDPPAGE